MIFMEHNRQAAVHRKNNLLTFERLDMTKKKVITFIILIILVLAVIIGISFLSNSDPLTAEEELTNQMIQRNIEKEREFSKGREF